MTTTVVASVPPLDDSLRAGAATGVGSLPHRSVHDAAAFALREYDVPAIPSLPRRSPAEGMIAQAVVGINGVTLGQYGSIAVDPHAVDPCAPVVTDLAQRRLRRDAHLPRRRRRPWPARPGEVAVRRPGDPRRGPHPHRRARRDRVRRRRSGRARPHHRVRGGGRRGAPGLAADRRPRRAVVRGPDARRVSRSRPIRRSTSCRGRWRRSNRSRRWACTAAPRSTSRPLLAAGPGVLSVPVSGELVEVAGYLVALPRGRRPGRVGSGVHRRADPDEQRAAVARAQRRVVRARPPRMRPGVAAPAQPRHAALRARPAHPGRRRPGVPTHPRGRPADQRAGRRQPLRAGSMSERHRRARAENVAERIAAPERARRLPQPPLPRARRPGDLRRRLRPARAGVARPRGGASGAGRRGLARPGRRGRSERALRPGGPQPCR